jgi:uncharacterized GH25 family protein
MRLLTAFVLSWVCALAAQHTGFVRSAGLPIPGAAVTTSRDGRQLSTYTDENGAFSFDALEPGAWKLEAWKLRT